MSTPDAQAAAQRFLAARSSQDEDLFRLADFLPDALFVHRAGIIDYVNPAGVAMLGYQSPYELVGKNITTTVVHPEDAGTVTRRIERLETTNERLPTIEVRLTRGDGGSLYVEAMAARLTLRGEGRNVVVCRDVSDRRVRAEQLDALFSIMGGLNRHSPHQMTQALRIASEALGAEIGIISRVNGNEYRVEYFHAPGSDLEAGQTFDLGTTYCAITLQADHVLAISQMTHSPHRTHPCFEAFGLESYIGAPIKVNDERYGTINFSSAQPRVHPWTDQDQRLVEVLAEWTGRTFEALEAHRELERARDELGRRARTDDLTGLPNRRTVLDQLEREALRARRHDRPLAVGLADVDRFKRVNDTHGHREGDRALRDVARVMTQCLRGTDVAGRFGGEEFLLILPEVDLAGGLATLERVRERIEQTVTAGGEPVTLSAGVAELAAGETIDDFVARADRALYEAKVERNRVVAASCESLQRSR